MKNIRTLFEQNPQKNYKPIMRKKRMCFVNRQEYFDGETIRKILNFINSIHKNYGNQKIPLIFELGKIRVADKLVYVIFECICYSLIKDFGHQIEIYCSPQNNILTEGIFSSPLKLLNGDKRENNIRYLQKFKQDIYFKHYRKLISGQEKQNTNYAGIVMQEVDSFLKFFDIIEEYRDQITEVIGELVGNACEHGKSDCLLDIDVTSDHSKRESGSVLMGSYYGINIVILDFSEHLLGDGISQKLKSGNLGSERYKRLANALNFHKRYFDDSYKYIDFCNIAALQDKISGREEYNYVGGTGLTKLIQTLQSKSDMDRCYVLSGARCVLFKKEFLEYDQNGWLGFNDQCDFFSHKPNQSNFDDCKIFFPGTAYNLNFIMKRGNVTDEQSGTDI